MFAAVQRQLEQNRGTGGRKDKCGNLFTGLVHCAYCGARMILKDKGKWQYLLCGNGMRGLGCARRSIRYDECELVVLANCRGLDPAAVLPNADAQEEACRVLRQRVADKTAALDDIGQRLKNLTDQIGRTKNAAMRDRYEAEAIALMEHQAAADNESQAAERELRETESAARGFACWQAGLGELLDALAQDGAGAVPLRLRVSVPDVDLGDRWAQEAEAIMEDIDPAHLRTPRWHAFVRWVMGRRMDKQGRYLRIHFTRGAPVDVVPQGSLASGMAMIDDGWHFVSADLGRLWAEFIRSGG